MAAPCAALSESSLGKCPRCRQNSSRVVRFLSSITRQLRALIYDHACQVILPGEWDIFAPTEAWWLPSQHQSGKLWGIIQMSKWRGWLQQCAAMVKLKRFLKAQRGAKKKRVRYLCSLLLEGGDIRHTGDIDHSLSIENIAISRAARLTLAHGT